MEFLELLEDVILWEDEITAIAKKCIHSIKKKRMEKAQTEKGQCNNKPIVKENKPKEEPIDYK